MEPPAGPPRFRDVQRSPDRPGAPALGARFGTGGQYLNFADRAGEPMREGVDSAFGRNLRRLAEVKATYDPTNFFQVNNNIVP